LIALPVAVGFYGVSGGFSSSQPAEEVKELQVEISQPKVYTPNKVFDSPDTKASTD
jgi:hypothetical protein